MGTYLTAQVCLNGHVVTDRLERMPEVAQTHCSHCGEGTITNCPNCEEIIRGDYVVEGACVVGFEYHPPNFCCQCGEAFPWHTIKLEAAKELVDELHEIAVTERKMLKDTIDDLSSDTPKTELAAHRYMCIVQKLGKGARSTLASFVREIATEAAKRVIFGN